MCIESRTNFYNISTQTLPLTFILITFFFIKEKIHINGETCTTKNPANPYLLSQFDYGNIKDTSYKSVVVIIDY